MRGARALQVTGLGFRRLDPKEPTFVFGVPYYEFLIYSP